MNIKQYIDILIKKWWVLLSVTFIAVAIGGLLSIYVLQPIYEADTSLFIGKGKSIQNTELNYNDILTSQKMVNDCRVIVKSRTITKSVIKSLKLPYKLEEFVKNIKVTSEEETRIITIKVRDGEAKRAADIANQLAKTFINRSKEIMEIEEVHVVDEAEIPEKAISPKPILNMMIAGQIGLLLAILIIFYAEYSDQTVKSSEDIEKYLGISVAGTIPIIYPKDLKRWGRLQ